MDIVVRGKNVDIRKRLRATSEEKISNLTRFAHDLTRVEVDFSEIRNPRVSDDQLCEVTLHLPRHFVKAHAAATEQLAALDLTIDKLEHQLMRLKDKRVARNHPRRRQLRQPAPLALDGVVEPDAPSDEEWSEGEALLVRTKHFEMKPMPPEEAALQLELLGHNFYLFANADSGKPAVIYRRRDGHLGLIEGG
ncbi:MAG: ribosome hibernation-promoting factor, HPF/YfiA family [Acidimicrobiia bacterium]